MSLSGGPKKSTAIGSEKWREDFPVQWGADNYITRREFTKYLALVSAATFLGNGYFVVSRLSTSHRTFPPMDVAGVNDLAVGESRVFHYPTPDDPALLVRAGENEFYAYNQKCTHLAGPVLYDHKRKCLHCPMHNGEFALETGVPVSGPPPRRLPKITLRIADARVIAEGEVRV
jgi:Rieske Fe-S protein